MRLRILFVVLVVLQLVPGWVVTHVPTSDGPAHLYNAWVMRELISGSHDAVTRYWRVDWHPNPNWITHASLALLMSIVPPAIAEKVLFSAIVVLFLGGAWMLAGAVDARGRPFAFLAFPLLFNELLLFGFYNFVIGAALAMMVIAIWWKQRDAPTPRSITAIALLLIACYFAHPMPLVVAIGSIGVMWLFTLRGRPLRQHAKHWIAIVPVIPLMIRFVLQRGGGGAPATARVGDLAVDLSRVRILLTFDGRQLVAGTAFFIVLSALVIATLVRERRREADAFAVITVVLLVFYFAAPATFAGGTLIAERTSLFIYLLPLAWLTPRVGVTAQRVLVAILSIAAIANAWFTLRHFRHFDRIVSDAIQPMYAIPQNSTFVPLVFSNPGATTIAVITHAADYAAIDRRLVDLANYQPGTDYFPIANRPAASTIDVFGIESHPRDLDVRDLMRRAEYFFTYRMTFDSQTAYDIDKYCTLVAENGPARVYRSPYVGKTVGMILLPQAGTARPIGGTGTTWWRVDQTVTNHGSAPVKFFVSSCAPQTPCDLTLAPLESARLAGSDPATVPYTIVKVISGDPDALAFDTTVRRSDDPSFVLRMPAVSEAALTPERSDVDGVSLPGSALRAYFFGEPLPAMFTIRLLAPDGSELASRSITTTQPGYWRSGDLQAMFAGVHAPRVTLRIETQSDARVWTCVTRGAAVLLPRSGTSMNAHRLRLE